MDRRLSDSLTVRALASHSCKFSVALFWLILVGFTLSARSQEATIVGTVTDPSGAVTNPTAMITAKIDGVTFANGGAEGTSGPLTIPIGSIASVTNN